MFEVAVMAPIKYLKRVREILDHLENTQLQNVDAAADLVLRAWECGGVIYCYKFGHGIEGDSINRAGGLVSVRRFDFSVKIDAYVPECLKDRRPSAGRDRNLAGIATSLAGITDDDVMLLSSVSGGNSMQIELAIRCRERNAKVVSFCSLAYAAKAESQHPSGKKLYDVSDVTVDIGVPYGDAAVEIPGIEVPVMPLSGVAMASGAWMIWGRAMEKAAAAGKPPSVLLSNNIPGGRSYNEKSREQYKKRGY